MLVRYRDNGPIFFKTWRTVHVAPLSCLPLIVVMAGVAVGLIVVFTIVIFQVHGDLSQIRRTPFSLTEYLQLSLEEVKLQMTKTNPQCPDGWNVQWWFLVFVWLFAYLFPTGVLSGLQSGLPVGLPEPGMSAESLLFLNINKYYIRITRQLTSK